MMLCCQSAVMLSFICVNYAECRKQVHYAECRYAECRYAESPNISLKSNIPATEL